MTFAAQKANDATMNDIMASIKRIMGDEQRVAAPLPTPAHLRYEPPAAPRNNVIEMSEQIEPRGSINDIDFAPAPLRAVPNLPRYVPQDTLLSSDATVAVSNSFNQLAAAMSVNSQTIEESVGKMLQPMLKQWLDDNLPPMVERLIKAEIERVARGGRK